MNTSKTNFDSRRCDSSGPKRRGAASLDYVLVLGIILPLAAIVVPTGKRIIQLVYEMTCAWLAWPFM